MKLHRLPLEAICPRCGRPGLEFVKRRGGYGMDLYRCTSPSACSGYTVHCRRDGNRCGIGAQLDSGQIARWKGCPDEWQAAPPAASERKSRSRKPTAEAE